MGIKNIY